MLFGTLNITLKVTSNAIAMKKGKELKVELITVVFSVFYQLLD